MQPWILVVMIALLYFGLIIRWCTASGRLELTEVCRNCPDLPFRSSLWMLGIYILYTTEAGGFHWLITIKASLYLLLIPTLLWHVRNIGDKLSVWDGIALFIIWLPFNFHFFGRRPNAIRGALDLQFIAVSACIFCIIYWYGKRQMSGMKLNFTIEPRDLGLVLLGLITLSLVIVPLGLNNGFLVPGKFWATELKNSNALEILYDHLVNLKFAWLLFGVTLLRAFPEELLFRSLIQNFLGKTWNKWTALIVTSFLFGASHLDNNAKSTAIADWNWTYASFATLAGFVYGLVFNYSSSLLYAILLHALVDAIWETVFKT